MTIGGFEITTAVLALGAITGMTYGLLAVGLVLIYRANGLVNFAHGQIGVLGAVVLGTVVVRWDVAFWLALPVALLVSAGAGALTEVAVIRRVRHTPPVIGIIATLGVAQLALLVSAVINPRSNATFLYPEPPGLPEFMIGALRVTQAYSAMLILSPLIIAAIFVFLRKSRYGIAMRGAADNPESARLIGVAPGRMSTIAWSIAGALSAFTAILIFPTLGFVAGPTVFGPSLLVRALAAAVIARMTNLPAAIISGIGVGIAQQLVAWNYPRSSVVDVILFGVILVALLAQPGARAARRQGGRSWGFVQPWPSMAADTRDAKAVRRLTLIAAFVAIVLASLLGLVLTNSTAVTFLVMMSFALVGLSVGVITGLAGQVSLGQFGLAAIGATVSWLVSSNIGNFFVSFPIAGLVTAAVSVAIGAPALRSKGLMLAVTTLAFALVVPGWLLQQTWMLGDGVEPGRPKIGTFVFDTEKKYYYVCLAVLVAGLLLTRNVWRSGLGRRFRAIRDNEDCAQAFGVRTTLGKIQAFAVAGFLAGLGGAIYGHSFASLSPALFQVNGSIDALATAAIGGVGFMLGPLLGALYIIGLPRFLPLDSAGLAATALGWLLLLVQFPAGVAALMRPLRQRILYRLGGRAGDSVAEVADTGALAAVRLDATRAASDDYEVLLAASGLVKRYGGVAAVDDVSIEVRVDEIVGIIGPNGAGKTSLFDLLSGFSTPDAGTIRFAGGTIDQRSPDARARLGLIRSFQDSPLFPTLTVIESLQLAQERLDPTRFILSVLGDSRPDRRKLERARELASLMGLERYADSPIMSLSTGTRRIAELAALTALEPKLLLLDEPSSGIAQRESEALGEVLLRVKAHLGATLMLIEHDMPLIMGLSDRIIAMDEGRVIAEGAPDAIRHAPVVVASYLGTDVTAIERSGQLTDTILSGDGVLTS